MVRSDILLIGSDIFLGGPEVLLVGPEVLLVVPEVLLVASPPPKGVLQGRGWVGLGVFRGDSKIKLT